LKRKREERRKKSELAKQLEQSSDIRGLTMSERRIRAREERQKMIDEREENRKKLREMRLADDVERAALKRRGSITNSEAKSDSDEVETVQIIVTSKNAAYFDDDEEIRRKIDAEDDSDLFDPYTGRRKSLQKITAQKLSKKVMSKKSGK
jgi:hypothetical protein